MKQFIQRSIILGAVLVVGATQLAFAAKSERSARRIIVQGRVLKIDKADRTLLVSDRWSKQLYLVTVPEGASFRIRFGANMHLAYPEFEHVQRNNIVEMICVRTQQEHLATLDDGSRAIPLVAAK